jgi:glycerate dehydrogenase
VPARVAGFEAVFANKSVIDRATIQANPQLKMVALTATGVDNVDLAAARKPAVAVCNLRDYCTASVAQHVFAMLLALTHRLAEYHALVRAGNGRRQAVLRVPVRDPRVAGPGIRHRRPRHPRQVRRRDARALGMRVEIANRPGGAPVPDGGISMTCCPSSTCSPCTARSPMRPGAS